MNLHLEARNKRYLKPVNRRTAVPRNLFARDGRVTVPERPAVRVTVMGRVRFVGLLPASMFTSTGKSFVFSSEEIAQRAYAQALGR